MSSATSNISPSAPTGGPVVQRQIRLPMSKAVEIAWKNIRMRLSRSLLVTSGIVLALAFLMSILTKEAQISSMRKWIGRAEGSEQFVALKGKMQQVTESLHKHEVEFRAQLRATKAPPKDAPKFDEKKALGARFADLQAELNTLPAGAGELTNALTSDPKLIDPFNQWLAEARSLKSIRDELTGPQQLESEMKQNGVPTTEAEIASNKVQTRWLLGLALLVAFVGILNAMLMSVTERFREIGTMKCLGALDSFIVKLFLIESLFQGVVGTSIGVLVGFGMSLLATTITYGSFAWKDSSCWTDFALAAVFCFFVGIGLTVAGAVYPAWQAARMQPIEAMRVET